MSRPRVIIYKTADVPPWVAWNYSGVSRIGVVVRVGRRRLLSVVWAVAPPSPPRGARAVSEATPGEWADALAESDPIEPNFWLGDDFHGEPTLWATNGQASSRAVIRRCDLLCAGPERDSLWSALLAGLGIEEPT